MQKRLLALSLALKGSSFSPDAVKHQTIHTNKIACEPSKCVKDSSRAQAKATALKSMVLPPM